MKAICINNDGYSRGLTLGQEYEISKEIFTTLAGEHIKVALNNGVPVMLFRSRFIPIRELRAKKLKRIIC